MSELPPLLERLTAVGLSSVIAYLSLNYIETPLRKGAVFKSIQPKVIISCSFLISLIVAAIAWTVPKIEKYQEGLGEVNVLLHERTSLFNTCANHIESLGTPACTFLNSTNTKIKTDIAVWGDSHAYTNFPYVEQFVKSHASVSATLYSHSLTPSLLPVPGFKIQNPSTNSFNAQIIQKLKEKVSNSPGIQQSVILASRWMYYLGKPHISLDNLVIYLDEDQSQSGSERIFESSLRYTIQQLEQMGVHKILIVLPYPEFRYRADRCLHQSRVSCDTPRTQFEEYEKTALAILLRVAGEFPNVRTVNPVPLLCDSEVCHQWIPLNNRKIPVVFDTDHPSAEAARYFGKQINTDLEWLIQ